jgi:AraC family transcriptional regulator
MSRNLPPGCFHGHRLKTCDVAGFTLSESHYSPGARIPSHSHSRAYLSILLNGSYREVYDGRNRYCRPLTAVFHPAGEVHSDQFLEAGGTIFRFEIKDDCLKRSGTPGFEGPLELSGGMVAWLATALHAEFNRMDAFSPLVMQGMILEILGQAARQTCRESEGQPAWLRHVTEFLRESSPEGITVARVAEIAEVHVGHLSRVFRRFYGCSVGEYIRRLRVEYAARALRSSQRPLVEIAVEAGFSDQSHFCRSFKLAMGSTPAQYRSFFSPR